MSWDTIERTDHEEGIVRISLDRPETHNSQNPQMIDEIDEAVTAIEAEDDSRVLIFDGNGPSFSSGHDLGRDGYTKEWTVEERLEYEEEYYFDRLFTIRDLDIPTIAQIHGYCGAAGLMLTSVCDLAIATEDAQLQNPVQRMAACGLELLLEPWEVGFRKAKEMLWTGESIDGTEAHELGMVNRAVTPEQLDGETMQLARKIAKMPPFAIKLSKQSLNHTRDEMGQKSSYKYHLLAHQLSHASKEWESWHGEANEIIEDEGMSAWVEHRDEPFDIDEE